MFATMDRETFICNHLKDKMGISIFAGAGVSCGSKLPLASPLLDFIVQSVMPEEISDKEDFKLSINSLPFEAFIEHMIRYTGDYDIFNIFKGKYVPNENHIFAAKMLEKGLIERIYTVNFDLLYETAYRNISKDFQVLYKDEHFTKENLSNKENKIIKLHGSAHDVDSMKLVLNSITNRHKRNLRTNVVEYMFNRQNKIIIIFGYSNSDVFDITPVLDEMDNKNATVIFIDHKWNKEFTYCKNSDVKLDHTGENGPIRYPFVDFPGFYIQDNTSDFIRNWHKIVFNQNITLISNNDMSNQEWKEGLKDFINSLIDVRDKFLGTIYNRIGKYDQAIWCYKRLANKPSHEDYAFACQQLAQIYNIKGENGESNKYLNAAINKVKEQTDLTKNEQLKENIFVLIACLFVKAENCLKGGNYDEAISLYNECLTLASDANFQDKKIQCLQGLSFAYYSINNIKESSNVLDKAINIASEEDDLWLLSDLYINKSELIHREGNFKDSLLMIDKAIDLKMKLHDYPNLIMSLINKGTILKNDKQYKETEKVYDLAEQYIISHSLTEELPRLLYQKVILYQQEGYIDNIKSYVLLKEAIPLFVKQGKIHYEGYSRIILGQFYEFMYKSFMVQIKNFELYNDELTDTISLLDKPLKVDFNRIPMNLSEKQIDEKFESMNIDRYATTTDKLHTLINAAIFTKNLAHEEIVKGLSLVHKTDLNYYNKILKRYS